jgi:hypothetical protein
MPEPVHDTNGRFASHDIQPIYDAMAREVNRIDQLRTADQTAVAAALSAAEKAVAAALIAAKEAVNKAEAAQSKTNENQNEFRAQLRDQAATFLTRNEYDLGHRALEEKITAQEKAQNLARGQLVGSSATWRTLLAVASAVAVVTGVIVAILVRMIP